MPQLVTIKLIAEIIEYFEAHNCRLGDEKWQRGGNKGVEERYKRKCLTFNKGYDSLYLKGVIKDDKGIKM